MNLKKKTESRIDWSLTVFPLLAIGAMALLLILFPENSSKVIESLRNFLVNDIGFVYILFGLGILIVSLFIACSKWGKIKLGNLEKPRYSNFSWGTMIFTSTMAADILYWALIEWAYYFNETPFAMENMTLAQKQD